VKIPKSIRIKDTVSLFLNKYQYKIVIVCPIAYWFRGNDLDNVKKQLTDYLAGNRSPWIKIKDQHDFDFCQELYTLMSELQDYDLRVEQPMINFYTNTKSNIEVLSHIDPNKIKFISLPNKKNPSLLSNTVIVKNLDYNYKVHIGKTRQDRTNFINWAKDNNKIRLTGRAIRDLSKSASWGGSYFYVKDDKTLTMVKLFLNSEISKIESVIKA
jgi:hypothetical protein